MSISITEVQTTCIFLMGLITLFLALLLPKYVKMERTIHNALNLLSASTLTITLHFCVQYILHKNVEDVAETRTVINMLFGIPISYFVNLSYLYLLRGSKIKKKEWWIAPIALLLSILVCSTHLVLSFSSNTLITTTYIMSFIYGCTLIYYRCLLLQAFFSVRRMVMNQKDHPLAMLISWTKWSLFILIITAIGFPFMTFCTNSTMRSIYGILSISSFFLYILSFVGYCLTYQAQANDESNKEETACDNETAAVLNTEMNEQLAQAINSFITQGLYTTSGITLKDAAIQMGISCNRLRLWLRTTEYEKFSTWILHLRIEKSKEMLLKYPSLNNQEIAEKCGFCDRQYFQLQFSKLEGISPSKWVKEQSQSTNTETQG